LRITFGIAFSIAFGIATTVTTVIATRIAAIITVGIGQQIHHPILYGDKTSRQQPLFGGFHYWYLCF